MCNFEDQTSALEKPTNVIEKVKIFLKKAFVS